MMLIFTFNNVACEPPELGDGHPLEPVLHGAAFSRRAALLSPHLLREVAVSR
jgi:hypothetical protein